MYVVSINCFVKWVINFHFCHFNITCKTLKQMANEVTDILLAVFTKKLSHKLVAGFSCSDITEQND